MQTSKKFWVEFIDVFKSLPALWKKSSAEYGDKYQRQKSFDILLDKYRELDKEADIFDVKRKINNIRSVYRREIIRVRKSEQSALEPEDIYTPTLWYFPHLDFLKDEEEPTENVSIMKIEREDEEFSPQSRGTPPPRKRKIITTSQVKIERQQKERPIDERTQRDRQQNERSQSERTLNERPQFERILYERPRNARPQNTATDKATALSASWEVLYRDLEERQKLYAYRIINDVLYKAALGKLRENSYKLLEMGVETPHQEIDNNEDGDYETQYYLTESIDNDDYVEKEVNGKRKRN